jgi:hypothetical protein
VREELVRACRYEREDAEHATLVIICRWRCVRTGRRTTCTAATPDRRNARAQPCVEANATKCLTSTIPLAILLDRWPAPAHLHEQGYYRHLFQHAHCQGQQAVLVPKRVAWEARV